MNYQDFLQHTEETGGESKRERGWSNFHMLSLLLIVVCYLFFIFSPIHDYKIPNVLLNPLTIVLVGVAAFRYRGRCPWVMLPSFGFALWYYCVQAIHGDPYLLEFRTIHYCMGVVMAMVLFFGTPMMQKPAIREKTATLLAAVIFVFLGLLAWRGSVGAILNRPFFSPFTDVALGMMHPGELRFHLFHLHANEAAVLFIMAMICGIYLLAKARRMLWKGLCLFLLLGLCLMLALTDSRTAFGMFALLAALLAFLWVWHIPGQVKGRFFAGAVAAVLAGGLALVTLQTVANWAIQEAYQRQYISESGEVAASEGENPVHGGMGQGFVVAKAVAEEVAVVETAAAEGNIEEQSLIGSRGMLAEFSTFTGRTGIYMEFFRYLQEYPKVLLWGTGSNAIPEEMNERLPERVNHMHNVLLQIVLVTGLPGLLIALCFLGMVGVQTLRLLLARPNKVVFSQKIWGLFVMVMLLNGLMEAFFFTHNSLENLMFFFSAGMVMAIAGEALPSLSLNALFTKTKRS